MWGLNRERGFLNLELSGVCVTRVEDFSCYIFACIALPHQCNDFSCASFALRSFTSLSEGNEVAKG